MTKKPYPNAPRVSRSSGTRPSLQRLPEIRPPLSNHFGLLDPGDDDHPVDLMVDRIPTIARRAQHLRRLAEQVQRRLGDDALFLQHEDLRLEQQTEREETYYNTGFQLGHLAGRAAFSDTALRPEVKTFVEKLQHLLATTAVPDLATTVVLLDHARALLCPLGPSSTGGHERRGRKDGARSKDRQQ
jgi:hypothetical protein